MGEYQDNSLGSRVFQRLREDILSGKYKEHDELRENTLGKECDCNRRKIVLDINTSRKQRYPIQQMDRECLFYFRNEA